MRRVGMITALSMLLLALSASPALAAISTTINPANAPTGAHFQARSSPSCTVSGLTVTCSSYQIAGVGNANASAALTAHYTATVDCFNPGTNPNNPIESHQTSFSQTSTSGQLSPKNGKLTVPQLSASPSGGLPAATSCPNPNWTPTIRPGSLHLTSFTYTLTFAGFTGAFITITGP